MINKVYGIKQFQTNLPQISRDIKDVGGHYLITNHNDPIFVTLPFEEYQSIEDILLEMSSPALQREIQKGREEYEHGQTVELSSFLESIE